MTITRNCFRFTVTILQKIVLQIQQISLSVQSLASISLHNMSNSTVCNEFLDIQIDTDGITVPDIRKWVTSGAYGFIFHGWVRLNDTIGPDYQNMRSSENKCFRRIVLRYWRHCRLVDANNQNASSNVSVCYRIKGLDSKCLLTMVENWSLEF